MTGVDVTTKASRSLTDETSSFTGRLCLKVQLGIAVESGRTTSGQIGFYQAKVKGGGGAEEIITFSNFFLYRVSGNINSGARYCSWRHSAATVRVGA